MFEKIEHSIHWSTRKKIQTLIDSQKINRSANKQSCGFPYNPELFTELDDHYDSLIDEIKLAFDMDTFLYINKFESIVFIKEGSVYWYYPNSDTLWTAKN